MTASDAPVSFLPDDVTRLASYPLAVLGPTASGKSALALTLHDLLGDWTGAAVELVSIDSMQVYRGMDIGTAKPTRDEQARVAHHLIDLVGADQRFTVAEFQAKARTVLDDVVARGNIPLLVGGTGLYLRAVIDDLDIPGQYPEVREQLDEHDTAELFAQLQRDDPQAATRMEPTNRRRILRALEVTVGSGQPFSTYGPGLETYPESRFVQVALDMERPEVDRRIAERYRQQLADGFLDEVRCLAEQPLSRTARQALGYRELLAHLDDGVPLDEAVDLAVVRTRKFARRQMRWFRRDPRLRWFPTPADPIAVLRWWRDQARIRSDSDQPGLA